MMRLLPLLFAGACAPTIADAPWRADPVEDTGVDTADPGTPDTDAGDTDGDLEPAWRPTRLLLEASFRYNPGLDALDGYRSGFGLGALRPPSMALTLSGDPAAPLRSCGIGLTPSVEGPWEPERVLGGSWTYATISVGVRSVDLDLYRDADCGTVVLGDDVVDAVAWLRSLDVVMVVGPDPMGMLPRDGTELPGLARIQGEDLPAQAGAWRLDEDTLAMDVRDASPIPLTNGQVNGDQGLVDAVYNLHTAVELQ